MYSISFHIEGSQAESITQLIEAYEPYSVCFESACDQELFDNAESDFDLPEWQKQKITALFNANFYHDTLVAEINKVLPNVEIEIKPIAEKDWQAHWYSTLKPIVVSDSITICPDACQVETTGNVIFLNPGMAFGTGSHETTRLCLQQIEKISDLSSKSLLDFGCGSGILGIAAIKLGALSAVGIDIDSKAIAVAEKNALKNDVANKLLIYSNDEFFEHHSQLTFDIVVANILSKTLIELAPVMTQLLNVGGMLLLSGILDSQVNEIKHAYGENYEFVSSYENNWFLLKGIRLT